MSDDLTVSSRELTAVEQEARRLLAERVGEIDSDGRLDGEHWFLALLREATANVRARTEEYGRSDESEFGRGVDTPLG